VRLNETESAELLAVSRSESMLNDSRRLAINRHNPLLVDGQVCPQRVVVFLTQYNEFLNHPVKELRPFIENDMKL